MVQEFKVEIPISASGGAGKGGASDELKKLNKNVLKLDKTMFLNIDVVEILSSLAGDLYKVMQPLFKILSLLFMVIFLPLMPIMKMLIKVVAGLIDGFIKLFGGKINFAEFIKGYVGPAIIGVLSAMLELTKMIWTAIWEVVKGVVSLLWEGFAWIVEKLIQGGTWLWKTIISAFQNIATKMWDIIKKMFTGVIDAVSIVWNFIKGLFRGTIDVGSNIWNFIKGLFKGTIDVSKTVWNWFKGLFGGSNGKTTSVGDAIITPQGVVKTDPKDFIIATKNPGSIGGKNITININNPSVRNDQDIKKMASEFSRVLQRQLGGRISTGI